MNRVTAKFLLIALFTSGSLCAQVKQFYMDASFNMDYFTNLQGFEIERPQNSGGFRFGFGFFETDSQKIRFNAEFGFSRRSLLRLFPGQEYRYSFNGLDWSVLMEYQPLKPIWLEAGTGLSLSYTRFESDENEADLGKGFQGFDIFLNGGFNIQVYKFIFLGTRLRYGLIPRLAYTPIGEYGGFENEKHLINVLTHEFILRIKPVGQ